MNASRCRRALCPPPPSFPKVTAWVNRHTARFRADLPLLHPSSEPGGLGGALRDGRHLLALLHSLHPAECPHPAEALGLQRAADADAAEKEEAAAGARSPRSGGGGGGSGGGVRTSESLGVPATDDEGVWEDAWRVSVLALLSPLLCGAECCDSNLPPLPSTKKKTLP
jgi:hypothetical protein